MPKVKLGDRVRDRITEYEGICTGIINYLNGCARIGIQSKQHDQNNLPVDAYWVDETTVDVMEAGVEKREQVENGGSNGTSSRYGVPKFRTPKI